MDGQQRFVRLRIRFVRVVEVVGGDQRNVEFLRQSDEVLRHPLLDGQTVVHEFDVVVLLAEDLTVFPGGRVGLFVLSQTQPHLNLSGRAAGRGDESLRIAFEQLLVQPGPLRGHRVQGGVGGGLEQVPHARVVPRQQGHMCVETTAGEVVALLRFVGTPLHARLVPTVRAGGDIGFDTDDGLDSGGGRLGPEVEGSEQVSVVGRGDRGHSRCLRRGHQIGEAGRTVQHGVFGMDVEVDEVLIRHWAPPS